MSSSVSAFFEQLSCVVFFQKNLEFFGISLAQKNLEIFFLLKSKVQKEKMCISTISFKF